MRTKKLIVMMALCAFSTTAVYAQRVETALVDDNPVINCTGMPAAAITTIPKGNTEAVLKTAAANATVFQRFAVAKADNNAPSQWSPAFTVCSNLGEGWRLPTQRELMLMWVLKAELEKTSGFTKFDASHYSSGYWGATENGSISSWYVNFIDGLTSTDDKIYHKQARCVREIALPL